MTVFTLPVRIYFEDTDFSGVVYHANYLKFFERGRTELLRSTGLGHREFFEGDDPVALTVRSMNILFNRPARIDDLLTVETRIVEQRGARIVFNQRAVTADGTILCEAEVTIACMDVNGRPRRLPPEVAARFAAAREATS